MSESPYRDSGLGSGETPVCLFCGSECDANAKRCEKCGVSRAKTAADETSLAGFACPRCNHLLEPKALGRAAINACENCHGMFLPSMQFSILVHDYLSGVELPLGTTLVPLPPGKEIDRVALLKCIACGKDMDRVNFASRSDAIVDICTVHGLWLDAGELVPMLHFVKTREERGTVPLTEQEIADRAGLDKDRQESDVRVGYLDLALARVLREHRRRY